MDFAIFKDLKNGFYMCNICVSQIKVKVWTAHTNGRKHRENVQKIKGALLAKTTNKRKSNIEEDLDIDNEPSVKKSRDFDNIIEENENKLSNENTMEIDGSAPSIRTPWQLEANSPSSSNVNNSNEQLIEGLPQGFFDNQKIDRKVRDTVEKMKQLDDEVDKFFKELAEDENKKDVENDEEIEALAINKDIELIDEQIERWRAINEFEKKKEKLIESVAATRSSVNPNYNRLVIGGNLDTNSDSDDDDNLNVINWRTKIL